MTAEVFFESIHTGKRYKVVRVDKEAGTITFVGKHNCEFTEPYSKERFEEMGYRPVKGDAPAPPPPPPSSAVVVQ